MFKRKNSLGANQDVLDIFGGFSHENVMHDFQQIVKIGFRRMLKNMSWKSMCARTHSYTPSPDSLP
jgi:hypothetical protein